MLKVNGIEPGKVVREYPLDYDHVLRTAGVYETVIGASVYHCVSFNDSDIPILYKPPIGDTWITSTIGDRSHHLAFRRIGDLEVRATLY